MIVKSSRTFVYSFSLYLVDPEPAEPVLQSLVECVEDLHQLRQWS